MSHMNGFNNEEQKQLEDIRKILADFTPDLPDSLSPSRLISLLPAETDGKGSDCENASHTVGPDKRGKVIFLRRLAPILSTAAVIALIVTVYFNSGIGSFLSLKSAAPAASSSAASMQYDGFASGGGFEILSDAAAASSEDNSKQTSIPESANSVKAESVTGPFTSLPSSTEGGSSNTEASGSSLYSTAEFSSSVNPDTGSCPSYRIYPEASSLLFPLSNTNSDIFADPSVHFNKFLLSPLFR